MRSVVCTYAIEILDASGDLLGAELAACVDDATALTLARTAVGLFARGAAARVACVASGRRWELGPDHCRRPPSRNCRTVSALGQSATRAL